MDAIIREVRLTLNNCVMAIEGNIVMTPAIVDAIDCFFDAKVPYSWKYDSTGGEKAWLYEQLGIWFASLGVRNSQLTRWITNLARPNTFNLGGFFNPNGFLTAMK